MQTHKLLSLLAKLLRLLTPAAPPATFTPSFSPHWLTPIVRHPPSHQAVTYQLGGFVGSALIPVPGSLRRPRATLLAASAAMLVFVGAFAAVLKLDGGPFAFIALAFVMYMYSG